ncbi:MAG: DUF4249 domain-containing protein [Bacteroidetes bacterium]|nr:MAG: DUF4249 domain-containing protein [Bacteroidota bacterium]
MTKHPLSFLMLVCGLALLSCERELEVPLPTHQPRLVANCLVRSGEVFQVFVSRSFGLNENVNESDIYLPDARVELWRDGQLEEVLQLRQGDSVTVSTSDAWTRYGYFSEHLAEPATSYQLVVTHPDFPALRQDMVMPSLPQVSGFEFIPEAGINEDGDRIQRRLASLQDPPDTANHYRLIGFYRERALDTSQTQFPSRSINTTWEPLGQPSADWTSLGYLLPDTDFDGQSVRLVFEGDFLDFLNEPDELYEPAYLAMEWQSWNEPAYRLAKEYAEHVSSYRLIDLEILFASQAPLPMYSNAEGGLGVFGGYTVRRDTLWF